MIGIQGEGGVKRLPGRVIIAAGAVDDGQIDVRARKIGVLQEKFLQAELRLLAPESLRARAGGVS